MSAPEAASVPAITADELKAEAHAWAGRIGVQIRELHVRPMRRKWASCSTSGRVSLNTDLLSEPPTFRAEAIVHELLHLKVPNHGKVFRALLRAYLAEAGIAPGRVVGEERVQRFLQSDGPGMSPLSLPPRRPGR